MQDLQSGLYKAVHQGARKEHVELLLIYVLYPKKKKKEKKRKI